MKYCGNCGAPVKENAKFCTNCGSRVGKDQFNQQEAFELTLDKGYSQSNEKQDPFYGKQSGLGIAAFIQSLTVILAPIGLIMAIVDLIKRNKSRKHGLSLAAIFISITVIIGFMGILNGSNNSTNSTQQETREYSTSAKSNSSKKETEKPEEYRLSCKEVAYDELCRNPESHKGERIKVTVSIAQILENKEWRVYTYSKASRLYSEELVIRDKHINQTENAIEDDIAVVYGTFNGMETVTRALTWSSDKIPCITAQYIDLYTEESFAAAINETILKSLSAKEYSYSDKKGFHYYLSVTNNSEYDIDLSANVKFYDDNGAIVDIASASQDVIEHGGTILFSFDSKEKCSSAEYSFATEETDWYVGAQSKLSYEENKNGKNLILSIRNNHSKPVRHAYASVLFFKNEELVGYDSKSISLDYGYEIKANEEISLKLTCKKEFDDYLVFFTGYSEE